MRLSAPSSLYSKAAALLLFFGCVFSGSDLFARVGGAGGHGGGHGGGFGGHSSYGGGYGHSSYHSYGNGGGGVGVFTILFIIIVVVVLVIWMASRGGKNMLQDLSDSQGTDYGDRERIAMQSEIALPPGLDKQKIAGSFTDIQDAWQRKDLSKVRKWLSDGMYQRLSIQGKMMERLGQTNMLNDIRIQNIAAVGTQTDGHYQTVDVAVSFTMNDSFVSDKYPQFNEEFGDDTDTEYWTFIKRTDAKTGKDLYHNNSCPNCGAPLDDNMGEITRCGSCKTLVNSADYDWVLSEITQADDYEGGAGLANDDTLRVLMQNDPYFAVQRVEDIASNVFMQLMETYTGGDPKRLGRFADEKIAEDIAAEIKTLKPFVFDRLYLNSMTLNSYRVVGEQVKLIFDAVATYRRVSIAGGLQMIDNDFVRSSYQIELSRNVEVKTPAGKGETVYSYECSSCGAPYDDTTTDHCSYCDALVVDKNMNWVLTGFEYL